MGDGDEEQEEDGGGGDAIAALLGFFLGGVKCEVKKALQRDLDRLR